MIMKFAKCPMNPHGAVGSSSSDNRAKERRFLLLGLLALGFHR